MANMTAWWTFILDSVCDFLLAEPICYLFGLVLLIFIVKFISALLHLT